MDLLATNAATGAIALLGTIAAVLAAYFSWRQLHLQRKRWMAEDARIGPIVRLGLSGAHSGLGFFHGVWSVDNRASFPVELVRIEALSPESLIIGPLDISTDGDVKGMRAISPGKAMNLHALVPAIDARGQKGHLSQNFLYALSTAPFHDRGRIIRVRFILRDVDNPAQVYVREAEAKIPMQTN